jgi:hypothetical protein
VGFGPFGESITITYVDGGLVTFDALGAHLLSTSGVRSACVAFTRAGSPVTVVLLQTGALVQFDALGTHLLATVT